MSHVLAIAATALWIAANFYLWSLKQTQLTLFLQSLVLAAVSAPALWWYVTRKPED